MVVGTSAYAALVSGSTSNSADINYGTAGAGTGATASQWMAFTAVTAGTPWFWADMTPVAIAAGNPYKIPAGSQVIGAT